MLNQVKYILLLLFIVTSTVAIAQKDSTLMREVEVTKAYKPTISDANKINEMPKIDETEHQTPKFDYNISSQPILNTFSVTPLKAATIDNAQQKATGYGLIRAGVGNYNKPYGEFFFNNLNSKKSIFGIHAKHLSSFGKIKLEGGNKVDAPYSKNQAEVYYKQALNKSVLSIDVDIKHDGFNYYGYPVDSIPASLLKENQSLTYQGEKQTFTKSGIRIGLKNPNAEIDDQVFNFNFDYHYFGTKTGQSEHFGEFEMDFQKPIETGTIITDAGITFAQSDNIYNEILDTIGKKTQTWFFVKPAWVYTGKIASVSLGINAWFIMDNDMDAVAKIAPNIRVDFMPVKDIFKFYAGLDGNYINNHYSKIAYENPFVDPRHDVKNSFEKIHFYGGIDGKFSAKTNFKVSVDYSLTDDKPLYFLNKISYSEPIVVNTFDILYDDINLLKFNLEIFHTSSERLNLLISGNYYAYNLNEQVEAWNLPNWDATFSLDYKITEQLSVGTDIFLIGQRKALIRSNTFTLLSGSVDLPTDKTYNLDTAFDLNVNANYQITPKFAAFGQLNNFGFQKYQRWFGYPVQSFNALVGVSYAF